MKKLEMKKMEMIEGGLNWYALACYGCSVIMATSMDNSELRAAFWCSVNLGCTA
jgi:hypothetical protein